MSSKVYTLCSYLLKISSKVCTLFISQCDRNKSRFPNQNVKNIAEYDKDIEHRLDFFYI